MKQGITRSVNRVHQEADEFLGVLARAELLCSHTN